MLIFCFQKSMAKRVRAEFLLFGHRFGAEQKNVKNAYTYEINEFDTELYATLFAS